jgi:stalled ribosome rescue protein Dom34
MKSFIVPLETISVASPSFYAERFIHFITERTRGGQQQITTQGVETV